MSGPRKQIARYGRYKVIESHDAKGPLYDIEFVTTATEPIRICCSGEREAKTIASMLRKGAIPMSALGLSEGA